MNLTNKFLILTLFLSLAAMYSCGNSNENASSEEVGTEQMETDKSGPEYTSAYICPMHCTGSGSDKPGKCPVCDMDYVANDQKDHDHDHDHDHDGHSH